MIVPDDEVETKADDFEAVDEMDVKEFIATEVDDDGNNDDVGNDGNDDDDDDDDSDYEEPPAAKKGQENSG